MVSPWCLQQFSYGSGRLKDGAYGSDGVVPDASTLKSYGDKYHTVATISFSGSKKSQLSWGHVQHEHVAHPAVDPAQNTFQDAAQ